jgi:UDP-N-acetylglucosamine diphosphorylase/glucosamine-1-phosphate N-acetyltransferase
MNLNGIYFFEDEGGTHLAPVTAWNAPWHLLLGTASLATLAARIFPDVKAEGLRLGESAHFEPGTYLFLNARLLSLKNLPELTEIGVWMCGSDLAGAVLEMKVGWDGELSPWLQSQVATVPHQENSLQLGSHFWDYIYTNGERIREDTAFYQMGRSKGEVHATATLLNEAQTFIGEGAMVAPGAVLDATKGPIILENGVSIGANAVITGPVFLDKKVTINPLSTIRPDVSIGTECKVGGEVACAIVMPNTSKAHHGYLGRSMVGSWANIAAGSATSTIKNTYGDISLATKGDPISTGQHSLGSLIGDHVKIGTNTVLSPGSSIGAYSNVYGAAPIPRYLPAFSWFDPGTGHQDFALDKAIEVADRVLGRRGINVSESQRKRMEMLFAGRNS